MKRRQLEIVAAVAYQVREWAEAYAEDAHFDDDLCGLCAIASGELHSRLKRKGIDSTLHLFEGEWWGHCFVEVGEYVVDVTVTQFDVKDKVAIEPITMARKHPFWNSHKAFNTVKNLKKYQRQTRWPSEQVDIQRGWKYDDCRV